MKLSLGLVNAAVSRDTAAFTRLALTVGTYLHSSLQASLVGPTIHQTCYPAHACTARGNKYEVVIIGANGQART